MENNDDRAIRLLNKIDSIIKERDELIQRNQELLEENLSLSTNYRFLHMLITDFEKWLDGAHNVGASAYFWQEYKKQFKIVLENGGENNKG